MSAVIFMKIELMHLVGKGYYPSSASVTWGGDDWRLQIITGSTYFDHDSGWGRSRQGPCINSTHKHQKFSSDFSVKLSPCICSHTASSCPGCWCMWYLAISGEDLSRYILTCMCDKSCFVQWQISLLFAQARPTVMKHHTSLDKEQNILILGYMHAESRPLL